MEEIRCQRAETKAGHFEARDLDMLRAELKALRDRNLHEGSFVEKAILVAMLGIKVLPAEDLRSRHIVCRFNLGNALADEREAK